MRPLLLASLLCLLGCLLADLSCECPCSGLSAGSLCACDCQAPRTVCREGFAKVCPQKHTGCEDDEEEYCTKDARKAVKHLKGKTQGNGNPSGAERMLELEEDRTDAEERGRGRLVQEEVKCGKGVPKFKCDFIFDYEPYGEVSAFKASKCTHKKKIEKCRVKLTLKDGCKIEVLLSNKGSKMETVGNWKLQCPVTTPNPTATTVATTTQATTTIGLYSHAGENVTVVGDGCVCVPSFLVSLGKRAPETRAKKPKPGNGKPGKPERPGPADTVWVRNRLPAEVRCKGVPKFNCTFKFDTDEFCDMVHNMEALQCNHRKEVEKCPIKLTTKIGCKVQTTITNKGAKMLVSPKVEVEGGRTRPLGFMESCVCIGSGNATATATTTA